MNTEENNNASLILITNHFPFGLYESFLENELPYLTRKFGKVIIICRDVASKGQRPLHGATIHRIDPVSSRTELLTTILLCAINAGRIWRYVRDELAWLKERNRKLSLPVVHEMVHQLVKSIQTARHIRRIMRIENTGTHVILYSYWLTSSALATTFVSPRHKSIRRISRAHGGDVYEYRNENRYLAFRRMLLQHLDRIFAISDDAAAHLRRQDPGAGDHKVHVARLGTRQAGTSPVHKGKRFTVVSCSFLVPVKRIHLLVDALEKINHLDIDWIHVGDGPMENEIVTRAKQKFRNKSNIHFTFRGALPNDVLMQFYKDTYVHLFVNTSSAEGIPVTIMEAQSFGIPVVAPRVGGVPEIVSEDSGRLFDADASPLTIANLITEVLELPPDDYVAMRGQAFQNWKTRYNADNNFSTFVAQIQQL